MLTTDTHLTLFGHCQVNVAITLLLEAIPNTSRIPERSWKTALWLLGFSATIFRVELLLLWAPISLLLLLQNQASFSSILTTNISACATAAGELIKLVHSLNL